MKKFHPLQKKIVFGLKMLFCVLGLLVAFQAKANDVVIIGFAADDPDQISFVTTTDIAAGTVIYFTDNEWTGTGFNTGEGNISYTAPVGGIVAGTVVVITNNAGTYSSSNGGAVVAAGGSLALATSGDQLYAYYGTSATAPTEVLSALSNLALSAAEDPAGDILAPNVVVIQYISTLDNIQYNGPRATTSYAQLIEPANWTGADVLPFTMNTNSFTFACATISNLTISSATSCSGDAIQVCVTANMDNAPNTTVLFNDGNTTLIGAATATPPIPRLHIVTSNPTNPYVMPAGPIYVGDIISLPGSIVHPLSTTSVPAGAANVSGATTTVYYTVTVSGTYNIICDVHSTMIGTFTALPRPSTSTQVCTTYSPTNTNCAPAIVNFSASVQNCTGSTLSDQSASVYPALSIAATGDGACGTINATQSPASCGAVTYAVTFTQGGTSTTASGSSFTPSTGQVGTIVFTVANAGAPIACATAVSSTVAFNCVASPVCPTSISISGAPATACQGYPLMMTAVVDQGVLGIDYTIQWEESISGGAFASVGAANGGQTLMYMPITAWTSGCGGESHVYRAILTPIGACAGSALTSNSNTTTVYPALSISASGDGACGAITAIPTPVACGTSTYSVTYTTGTGPTSGTGTTFTPPTGTVGTVTFTLTNSGAPATCSSASSTAVAFNCPAPICSLIIGTVTVSACSFSGGQSTAIVSVPLTWANAPVGEDITVTVQGATAQTITSPAASGIQTLTFTVPADGVAGKTINATFVTTTTCSDSDTYNAPASCDPCVGFAAPNTLTPISVCESGSTTITPSGGGTGGSGSPIAFIYTWDFEGGITGDGISNNATVSGNAPAVVGGAGITLLTQAAGSGCTAAVSSNGYTGATGVPGTQADALANGDYFEFCIGTAQTGYTLAVTGLAWNHRASSTVTNYAIYAANDLSTSLASGSGVTTSCTGATATFAANSATCYRIYYWGATSATSTLRIDNMVISATATTTSSTTYNYYTTDPAGGGATPTATGASYTPTVAPGANVTYYVTAANGTCESTAVSVNVSVTAVPDAGADNTATVCDATAEGTTTVDLTTLLGATADAGGTFAAVGSAPALIGTTFDGNGLTPGTYSYTYTVNAIAPCLVNDVATFVITVNDCVGAVCSLTIGTVTVSACTFSGGQSTATVSVPLTWANAPAGENITVTVQGATAQTITSPAASGTQTLTFTVPADGVTSKTINATFVTTTTCSDSDIYDAPASCDPCVGFAALNALTPILVCEGGSTTIIPSGGGNGSGTIIPVLFTYTWDFEGSITGSGVASNTTLSGNAPAVAGGAGITLLTQAAGSGCTAAVSSNGYIGATGVPGTQADALANGDYFEFCIGTAQTGYTLAVTGLAWNHRASSTVTNYAIYAANDLSTSLASGSGVTTSCTGATATFAANSATCYRIYYWGATSATSTLRIDNMVINATATPISAVSYNFYTTDPAGGGQTPVASGFTYTPTVAPGTNATYYVTAANGTCESTAVAVNVSVTANPNAGSNATSSVCNATAEGTTTIDLATLVSGANGTGTFAPVGTAPALVGTVFDGNGLASGIYSYDYTVNAVTPCTGSDVATFAITVNDCVVDCSTFAAPIVTSPIAVCEGNTIIISPSGGGSGGPTPEAAILTWNFENAADLSGLSNNVLFVGNPAAPTAGAGVAALTQAPALAGGCSAAVVTSGFNATVGTNGQADALISGDYMEFCVGTVQAGYTFHVSGMTWDNRISGTGPANYAVYAANNLATPLATGSITTAVGVNACETETVTFASTANCFRIYAWGATSSGGTFRIDSMVINGTAIPAGATAYNFYDANPVPGPANTLASNVYSYSPTVATGTSSTIYVTADNGTCESTAVPVVVSVTTLPNAGADNTATACNATAEGTTTVDVATLVSATANAGGSFAPVGTAPALSGTTFDGNGLNPGVYQYTYTVVAMAPCVQNDVATFSITVNDCVVDQCAAFAPPLVDGVVACQSDAVSLTPTGGGAIPVTDLFISEYVEGAIGSNKCLEIYNGTANPIVLDGVYSVKLYSNGNPLGSTPIALMGTIASGDVFVICNPGASAAFLAAADQTASGISFNGNDAVALLKNGLEIDIFGNIGCDPVTAWTDGSNSTINQTLVRVPVVATGIATDPDNSICNFPTLGTQWTSLGADVASNLGFHVSSAGTVAIAPTSYNIYADNGGAQGALLTNIAAGASYSPTGLPAGTTTYWVSAVSTTPVCESTAIPVDVFLYGPITATPTSGDCTNTIASISQDNPAYTAAYVVNYTTGTGPAFGPGFAFDYSALVPGVAGVVTFTVQYTAAPAGCNVATFDVPFDCTTFPCSLTATAMPTACSGTTYDLNMAVTPSNQLYNQFIVNIGSTQYGPYNYTVSPISIIGLAGNGATNVSVTVTDYAGWVVNEMLYDPPLTGGDANGDGTFVSAEEDFVELVNFTGASQNISGFTLLKNATRLHTFPAGTIIPNGCGIVVFGGGTPTGTFGGMTVQTSSVGAGAFNLSANGTHVIALQNGATIVASATYTAAPSDDASATRNPDVTGGLVLHSTVNSSRFSPGTQVDGTSFVGCGSAYSNCTTTITYNAPLCTVTCPTLTGQDVDPTAICSGETIVYTIGTVSPATAGAVVTWVYSTIMGFDAYSIAAIPFTGSLPANIGCTPVTYYLKARLDGVAGCQVASSEYAVNVYPQINYTVTAQGACTATVQAVCPGFMVHYTDPTSGQVMMGNSYTASAGTVGTIAFIIMQANAPVGCDEATVNVAYNCPGLCPTLDDTQAVATTAICSGGAVSYTIGGVLGGNGIVTWVYSTTAGFNAYGTGVTAFTGSLPANTSCTAATYYLKARLDGATGCTDVSAEFAVTVYPNITFTTSPGGCTASITANCPGFNVSYTDPTSGATVNGNSYTAAAGASGNVVFTITNTSAPIGFTCRTASASVAYNCAALVCSTLTGQGVSSTAICSGGSVNYTVGSVINNSYTGGIVTWVYGTTAGFNAYGTGATVFTGTLPANTGCTAVTYYLKARLDNIAACQAVSAEFVITVYPAVSGTVAGQGSCMVSVTPNCPNFTVSYTNTTTGVVVNSNTYTGTTCTQGNLQFTVTNPAAPIGLTCASTTINASYNCIDATCSGCQLPTASTVASQGDGGSGAFAYTTYTITVTGGTLPYNFNWDNSGYVRYDIVYNGTGVTITIIATDEAIYNVTVTDQNGCYTIVSDEQNSSVGVSTLDITNYTITGASTTTLGGVNITVFGGGCSTGQYTYLWSNGATTEDISGVPSGWYSVTVTCPISGQTTTGWYWVPKIRRGRTKTNDILPAATIAAMPNPFSQVSSLEFSVAESGRTQISVFDMAGREVGVLFDEVSEAGKLYRVFFDASHLPAGIYTAQLVSDNGAVEIIKLVLTK